MSSQYFCKYIDCFFKTNDLDQSLLHITINHAKHGNFEIKCVFKDCIKSFKQLPALINHIRHHPNKELNFNQKIYKCFCDVNICFSSILELKHHYVSHIPQQNLYCFFMNYLDKTQECPYKVNNKQNYYKHIYYQHNLKYTIQKRFLVQNNLIDHNSNTEIDSNIIDFNENDFNLNDCSDNNNNYSNISSLSTLSKKKQIEEFYMTSYIKYKDKLLMPKSDVEEVFQDLRTWNSLFMEETLDLINYCQDLYKESFKIEHISDYLKSENHFSQIDRFYRNESKKKEWLSKTNFFVEPIEIDFTQIRDPTQEIILDSLEHPDCQDYVDFVNENLLINQQNSISFEKIKKESFHYVSIIDTIKSLFHNQNFAAEYFKSVSKIRNPNKIDSFYSTQTFKNNQLFSKFINSIQLSTFNDGFDCGNPLGDSRKSLKYVGVYFKINNFDPIFMGKLQFIQLICICKSSLVKKYGMNKLLRPAIEEIKKLEVDGVDIKFNGETINLKGTICFNCADSLAANSSAGLVESFCTDGYCRFCDLTKHEINQTFREDQTRLRTLDQTQKYLQIKNEKKLNHFKGVKTDSIFNELKYFKIIEGQPPDLMHDMLEGVIPLTFGYMMHELRKSNHLTCDQLNSDLRKFKYGRVDGESKVPCELFDPKSSYKSVYGFKLNATHTWTLSRIFPLMYGEKLKFNIYYLNYLKTIQILNLLLHESYDENLINKLESLVENYLQDFLDIYKHKEKIHLMPKQHFLIHYGTSIKRFGPPVTYWLLRFEGKHSYFKNAHDATHCNINVSKSLAYRHQNLFVYHLMSPSYMVISRLAFGVEDKEININNFRDIIECSAQTLFVRSIIYNEIKYHKNDIILIKEESNFFYQIKFIQVERSDVYNETCFLYLESYVINFIVYLNAFKIEYRESRLKKISLDKINSRAIDLYSLNNSNFVILKYPMKN